MRNLLLVGLVLLVVGCSQSVAPPEQVTKDKPQETGGDPDGTAIDYFVLVDDVPIPIVGWLDIPDETPVFYFDAQGRVHDTTWGGIKGGYIGG